MSSYCITAAKHPTIFNGETLMEIQKYNMPEELYYEENHYWIRVEGDILVMGMDDFAQQMAGEIVYVQLHFEGKKLANEELETNTALINEDCYGKGWMYKIQPDDMGQIHELIHGSEAVEKWLLADIEKYKK